jgi:hypothetical protein
MYERADAARQADSETTRSASAALVSVVELKLTKVDRSIGQPHHFLVIERATSRDCENIGPPFEICGSVRSTVVL